MLRLTLKDLKARKPRPGRVVDRRFELSALLGEGGFGEVWAAHDQLQNRRVALKILAGFTVDDPAIARFKQEFAILTQVAHPSINPVYDFGHDATLGYYFTAGLVQGVPLMKALAGASVETIERVMVQALRALAYLHSRGIYHFDIKPANLLVENAETAAPRVQLIDFGLATLQPTTGLAGTPSYMAPELFLGEAADGRADLYALGVVWYTCLTRRNPFQSLDFEEAKAHHLGIQPIAPSEARPTLPTYLDAVVMRLLAKNPAARYASAAHALRDVRTLSPLTHDVEDADTAAAYVPSGALLVARDTEQAEIQAWLTAWANASPNDRPRMVLVQGKPGMGKTVLLQAIKYQAQLRGLSVLALWGPDDSSLEIFTERLAEQLASPHSGVPLVVLMDDLDRLVAESPLPALTTLLAEVWTQFRASTGTLLLCGGVREIPVTAAQIPHVSIPLRPFTVEAASEYLAAIASIPASQREVLARRLVKRSGGCPALLTHLVTQLIRQGQLVDASGLWGESQFEDVTLDIEGIDLPRVLLRSVESGIAALPVTLRPLMETLAMCQTAVEPRLLQRICGVAEIMAPLAELLAHGWIRQFPTTQHIEIADPAVADVLRGDIPLAQQQAWHRKITEALQDIGAAPQEIDRHQAYSGDTAAAFPALLRLCEAEAAAGQLTSAIRRLQESLGLTRDITQQCTVLALLARYQLRADQLRPTHATIDRWIALLDPQQQPRQYFEAIELRTAAFLRGQQFEEARTLLVSACREAQSDPVWSLRFRNTQAKLHMLRGEVSEALAVYETTWDTAVKLAEAAQRQIPNNERSQCWWLLGEESKAATSAREELALLDPAAFPLQVAIRRSVLARALHREKQPDAAQEEYTRAIEAARQAQDIRLLATLYNGLGNLLAESNRTEAAIPEFERALPLCYRIGDLANAVAVSINLGHCLASTSQTTVAEAHLRAALAVIDGERVRTHSTIEWQCRIAQLLGDCARRQRAWSEATRLLNIAWNLATQHNLTVRFFGILLTRGEVARDQQQWDIARQRGLEAQPYIRVPEEQRVWQEFMNSLTIVHAGE